MEAKHSMRPERVLAGGFLALIAVGTLLLALPACAANGKSIGLFNSLFTATSAVCVTGLIVVDTGTAFSLLGHCVLLVLIELGGLGFMIFATLIMMILRRRMTLNSRMIIKESMGAPNMADLGRLARWYGLLALGVELCGAGLLAVRFVPAYGWGMGGFYSLFHAVSAFCNAGFDLFGHYSSLTAFDRDPLVLLTIAVLIILGGLGFAVMLEVFSRRCRWRALSLHTKLVLTVSGVLLLAGWVFYGAVEWNNPATLDSSDATVGSKLLNAFFQSATMRTAGFNSVDLSGLRDGSKLFSAVLMFIGASPASTGGGVKTTTMSVLLLIVLSVIRGEDNVNVFGKRLPSELMRRALSILFITLAVLLIGTIALTLSESGGASLIDLMFESASAVATVGVSAAGTPGMSVTGKAILIPMMYFGRVGPLTLALALANKQRRTKNHLKYPEEHIMIG